MQSYSLIFISSDSSLFLQLLGFLLPLFFHLVVFLYLYGYFPIIILHICVCSLKFWLLKFYLQQIFLIHRFCICKFTYLLKFIRNPRISIHGTFPVIHAHVQRDEKFQSPDRCSQLRLSFAVSLFQLSYYKQVSFSQSQWYIFHVFVPFDFTL